MHCKARLKIKVYAFVTKCSTAFDTCSTLNQPWKFEVGPPTFYDIECDFRSNIIASGGEEKTTKLTLLFEKKSWWEGHQTSISMLKFENWPVPFLFQKGWGKGTIIQTIRDSNFQNVWNSYLLIYRVFVWTREISLIG